MDFDFPSMDDMNAPNQNQAMPMQNLLNANPTTPNQPNIPWLTAADLPSIHLDRHSPAQPIHPAPETSLKRPSVSTGKPPTPPSQLDSLTNPVHNTQSNGPYLDDSPQIEPHVVGQMGGLPYADLCKERARERFKELKKNEHMAKGDFDRMKRRKKGDTSMTPRQKYLRRLRMNQDSAAAARYAQEVYVHVLEKLVKTTEVEKRSLLLELSQLRQQNALLLDKVSNLEEATDNTNDPHSNLYETERNKQYDAIQVAKLVDLLTTPETVSAQANDAAFAAGRMGIQPAPAV